MGIRRRSNSKNSQIYEKGNLNKSDNGTTDCAPRKVEKAFEETWFGETEEGLSSSIDFSVIDKGEQNTNAAAAVVNIDVNLVDNETKSKFNQFYFPWLCRCLCDKITIDSGIEYHNHSSCIEHLT